MGTNKHVGVQGGGKRGRVGGRGLAFQQRGVAAALCYWTGLSSVSVTFIPCSFTTVHLCPTSLSFCFVSLRTRYSHGPDRKPKWTRLESFDITVAASPWTHWSYSCLPHILFHQCQCFAWEMALRRSWWIIINKGNLWSETWNSLLF